MRRFVVISAAVHLVVLVLLPLLPNLGGRQPIAMEVFAVELVDVPNVQPVEQPAEEPPEPEAEPVPAEERTPEESPIPEEPVKQPVRKTITPPPPPKEEKSLREKLDERLKSVEEPKARREPSERPESTPQTPTGSTKVTAGRVADYYLTALQGKITRNWKQPSVRFAGGGDLTVRVTFRVMRSGEMTALRIAGSSGWSTVDESARQAVRSAAPFAELPPGYPGDHLDVTVDFTVTQ
ncbi:MAG: TonB family protein [Candidatus Eisenbacteria bacterium]|nr:TonB family protein [Candidatus Eisenbacteria bacterium]